MCSGHSRIKDGKILSHLSDDCMSMSKLGAYSQQGVGDRGGAYIPTYTRHGNQSFKSIYIRNVACLVLASFVAHPSPLALFIMQGWGGGR